MKKYIVVLVCFILCGCQGGIVSSSKPLECHIFYSNHGDYVYCQDDRLPTIIKELEENGDISDVITAYPLITAAADYYAYMNGEGYYNNKKVEVYINNDLVYTLDDKIDHPLDGSVERLVDDYRIEPYIEESHVRQIIKKDLKMENDSPYYCYATSDFAAVYHFGDVKETDSVTLKVELYVATNNNIEKREGAYYNYPLNYEFTPIEVTIEVKGIIERINKEQYVRTLYMDYDQYNQLSLTKAMEELDPYFYICTVNENIDIRNVYVREYHYQKGY